jgi:hypothetical protein
VLIGAPTTACLTQTDPVILCDPVDTPSLAGIVQLAMRIPPLSVVSMNIVAPPTIVIPAHAVMCIPPLSVVSIHMVASATMVFRVVMRIQPLLVVFIDTAAPAVVELAAPAPSPAASYSNDVSVGT